MGQETIVKILELLPAFIDQVGFFQFIILVLVLVFGAVIVKGKLLKNQTPSETMAHTVAPITCAWGEVERSSLTQMRKDVEYLRDKMIVVEDRLRKL